MQVMPVSVNSSMNKTANSNVNFGISFDNTFRNMVAKAKDLELMQRVDNLEDIKDGLKVYTYDLRRGGNLNYYVPPRGTDVILPKGYEPKYWEEYMPMSMSNENYLKVYGKNIEEMVKNALDYFESLPSTLKGLPANIKAALNQIKKS